MEIYCNINMCMCVLNRWKQDCVGFFLHDDAFFHGSLSVGKSFSHHTLRFHDDQTELQSSNIFVDVTNTFIHL